MRCARQVRSRGAAHGRRLWAVIAAAATAGIRAVGNKARKLPPKIASEIEKAKKAARRRGEDAEAAAVAVLCLPAPGLALPSPELPVLEPPAPDPPALEPPAPEPPAPEPPAPEPPAPELPEIPEPPEPEWLRSWRQAKRTMFKAAFDGAVK